MQLNNVQCSVFIMSYFSGHIPIVFISKSLLMLDATETRSLVGILQRKVRWPNEDVVRRMRSYYSVRVLNILLEDDANSAEEVYNLSRLLPSTATGLRLRESGITILERCNQYVGSDSTVILYGQKDAEPVALKRLVKSDEIERLQYLSTLNISCPTIIKFELIQNNQYVLMPRLISNILEGNLTTPSAQIRLCTDMISAVEYLHNLGLAHMDIKPANIGVNEQGTCILLDIGNATTIGNRAEVTEEFVPLDFAVSRRGELVASPAVDFGLIAATLLSKLLQSQSKTFSRMRVGTIIKNLTTASCDESVVQSLSGRLRNCGFLTTAAALVPFSTDGASASLGPANASASLGPAGASA